MKTMPLSLCERYLEIEQRYVIGGSWVDHPWGVPIETYWTMSSHRTEIKPSGTFTGGEIWCDNNIMASRRLFQQTWHLRDVVSQW